MVMHCIAIYAKQVAPASLEMAASALCGPDHCRRARSGHTPAAHMRSLLSIGFAKPPPSGCPALTEMHHAGMHCAGVASNLGEEG